jgi:hypothetical protein
MLNRWYDDALAQIEAELGAPRKPAGSTNNA